MSKLGQIILNAEPLPLLKPPLTRTVRGRSFLTGFTLVEILLALLIFSIISGSLYFTVSVGLKAADRAKNNFEVFQELRICVRESEKDLRSFFYDEALDVTAFEGGADSLSFISYKPDGLYKITYYQQGRGFLRYIQKMVFEKAETDTEEIEKKISFLEGRVYHLASLLKKVEFKYLDIDKEWQDSWEAEGEYPAAIKVVFYFAGEKEEEAGYQFEDTISIPAGKKIIMKK
ncbi:MAG: prepilin-type N-terminal cleavage/methylation domain-containing protein [Candidatus Omnitrophota bacterium]